MKITFISLFLIISTGCKDNINYVILPSITTDMTLSENLTYSAFAVLNETSAHLGFMSKDLSPEPMILSKYKANDTYTEFILYLDKNYLSFRNETVNAHDVEFSIKQYITNFPQIAAPFTFIYDSNKCKDVSCRIEGLSIVDEYTLKIKLNQSNRNFIFSLMNPWFVIFKKDKSLYEIIESCKVPYQTGKSEIISCNKDQIKMKILDKLVVVTNKDNVDFKNKSILISDNPGVPPGPTLTILTAYANPSGFNNKTNVRKYFMRTLRNSTSNLASKLLLLHSHRHVSRWMNLGNEGVSISHHQPSPTCLDRKIKVLLDTSLPFLEKIRSHLQDNIHCPMEFIVTTADKYFENFKKVDIGIAWFTPDEKAVYNFFSCFDCGEKGLCYFNWNDSELQKIVDNLKKNFSDDYLSKKYFLDLEELLKNNEYSVPIAEMNWWIKKDNKIKAIHPSGLAQVKISDFISQ